MSCIEPDYDDFGWDEVESPFECCGDDEDWDEDEEEEDEDDEPPRELTPEEIKEMSKNIQKMLKEGKERSDEIWKKVNIKNSQLPN